MVYHEVTLNPTDGQMSDLAQGEQVMLSHHHFSGDVKFHLTGAQVKQIREAHEKGRGCKLKLSAAQIKYMMGQHGSGRFSDLLHTIYGYAKPHIKNGIHAGINYGANALANKITEKAGLNDVGPQHAEGFFGDMARTIGHAGVDGLVNLAGGAVKPRRGRPPARPARPAIMPQHAEGFLGDFARTVGHAGVDGLVKLAGGAVKPKRGGRPPARPALPPPPAIMPQHAEGFFGDFARTVGHAGVDGLVNLAGGSVGILPKAQPPPNPLANPNEALRKALYQKKASAGGRGLHLS